MIEFIAEFCQNHKGDPQILKEMIHRAAEAGVTHAKIQTIFADDLTYRPEFEEGKVQDGRVLVMKRPYDAEYRRLKGLELTYGQQAAFVEECGKNGIVPLTTCFTRGSIPLIAGLGMKTVKVASYDCASLPLIIELSERFDSLIVSTGASYDTEIEAAARYLRDKGSDFSLLHCVTIYPTPLQAANLKRMEYLRRLAPKVGFSDHTLVARDGIKASLCALYLGADIIERHFTILPAEETKDGPVSVTPSQMKEMSAFSMLSKNDQALYIRENIPDFEEMIGTESRELTHEELVNRAYYRGRFATKKGDQVIYNWEDTRL